MDKIKSILQSYRDGIYSEREALYRIVELPTTNPDNPDVKAVLFDWLDGKVDGKPTLRRLAKIVKEEK